MNGKLISSLMIAWNQMMMMKCRYDTCNIMSCPNSNSWHDLVFQSSFKFISISQVNKYVRLLIDTMDTQGKKWYGSRNMKVPDPTKVITPYGGRLIWKLPGKTKVVCHLKV